MRKLVIILLSLVFISGCGLVTLTTSNIEASGNKESIQKISMGMESNQVKRIMGAPARTESFLSSEGKNILIWFYLIEGRAPFRRLDDSNYTPIIFEGDKLIGWGNTSLDKIKKK